MKHLFLCTLPRSGSTLLLEHLDSPSCGNHFASAGEMYGNQYIMEGNPFFAEFMGDLLPTIHLFQKHGRVLNPDFNLHHFQDMVSAFYREHQQNGFITVKWFQERMAGLEQQFGNNRHALPRLLEETFGPITCVYLKRRDRWRQAISFYLANAAHQWRRRRGEPPPAYDHIPFDFEEICFYRKRIEQMEKWWDQWFEETGYTPAITCYYEDLDNNRGEVLASLEKVLGLPIHCPREEDITLVCMHSPTTDYFYQQIRDRVGDMERPPTMLEAAHLTGPHLP